MTEFQQGKLKIIENIGLIEEQFTNCILLLNKLKTLIFPEVAKDIVSSDIVSSRRVAITERDRGGF